MSKKIEKSFDLNLSVTYDYYPGYPAPFAQSHDDPRFSDPGEPPYVDSLQVILDDIDDIDLTDLIEEYFPKTYARLENMAYERGAE